jgi:C4-dicarboxylate-specific signal transduction histidine kinase
LQAIPRYSFIEGNIQSMGKPDEVKWIARLAASAAVRYGLALISVAAAAGLAQLFLHFHLALAFNGFALTAIAITFWCGGTKPGILAAVLSALVRSYIFDPQINSISRVLYDLVFLVFALLMTGVTRARDNLEVRVAERTAELTRANEDLKLEIAERNRAEEALRQSQVDLARISRVTTMGELTASLAHEVNQPIAAAVTDANTCLRWLTRDQPDLGEARDAASRMVRDAARATEIISRIRSLFKKGTPRRELVDVNEIIRGMIALLHSEAARHSISMRTELPEGLPQIMGDRVQLQQVLMNLMINGIEAMNDVDGPRELSVKSQSADEEQLMVSVNDTGVGLPPQQAERIFDSFFTTKQDGTGMGLRISRSIVESHGGRLWAADNPPRGASFQFTLPSKTDTHE